MFGPEDRETIVRCLAAWEEQRKRPCRWDERLRIRLARVKVSLGLRIMSSSIKFEPEGSRRRPGDERAMSQLRAAAQMSDEECVRALREELDRLDSAA